MANGREEGLLSQGQVTVILQRLREGDQEAARQLLPHVYAELRRIAGSLFRREGAGHTLQPTAVVHEAWMRIERGGPVPAENRKHFLALAARVMRQVLVDHARRREAGKRGGEWERVTLSGASVEEGGEVDTLDLHEALDELARVQERAARVVELRWFGGLTIEEAAEVLDVSHTTVEKDWVLARGWLRSRLEGGGYALTP